MKRNLVISVVLILFVVISRLVPHVWNVAPVAAAALLAGAIMPRRWAIGVPLIAMFISDAIIGFYYVPVMLTVYASFALMAFLGSWLKKMQPHRILLASIASSTFFFLTTNFAVWATAGWYEKSWSGLMMAYTLAIPFFRNTMLGDLVFTGVMFGIWVLATQVAQFNKVNLDIFQIRACKSPAFYSIIYKRHV